MIKRRLAPLRVRLPLTVAILLAGSIGVVLATSYRSVRRSVAEAAADRLRAAGLQVAAMLDPSVRRSRNDALRLGARPEIVTWLRGGSPAGARPLLDSVLHASPQNATLAVVRVQGDSLITGEGIVPAVIPGTGVGPFYVHDDSVFTSVTVPLLQGLDTLGKLIVVRRLAGSATGTNEIGALLGDGAALRIGNADGSVWTDFTAAVPSPVSKNGLSRLGKGQRQVLGDTVSALVPVASTPWLLWVGQPSAQALAASSTLLRRLATLAFFVVLAGVAVAWWLIRRLTRPLDELALAADAVGRGERGRRVPHATRDDEIGRVGIAFNRMTEEIEAHHDELEEQVAERTHELQDALVELEIAHEENKKKDRLATLGHLAGGVGHELRNPLGVMTNSLYVLEMMITQPDPMIRDYLGILRNQISLCEKIVADLLDFARTKPPVRTALRIDSLLRQQVERLGPLSAVKVEWDLSPSLPMVEVDGTQIGQIVFNLVANAVQAMPEGGSLLMRAFHDGNGSAVVEVKDTGPGIPDDVAKHLFEPLFTTKARGLGLGLSVSRMLAENNGGRLWFTTEMGVGTTFSLALPVTQG
jgi:signal transduction histidine kinase